MIRLPASTLVTSTLAASTLLLAAAPAFAADLPSRYYRPAAPYYDAVPVFAWSGLYAGAVGAFGIGSFTQGGGPVFGSSPLGGLGGATLGYNYQSGNLLVGAEGDISFGSISDQGDLAGAYGSGAIHGIGTARVRVGYVWDRALLYVTGGYAGTMLDGKVSDFSRSPNLMFGESHYLNGYAVGAGVEYAITTKISVKGEYLYTGFGTQRFFEGTRTQLSAGAGLSLIRAGVNYHF